MNRDDVQGLHQADLHGPIPRSWYPAPPAMRVSARIPPPPLDCFAHGPVTASDGKLVFVIPSCVQGWLLCVRATQFDGKFPCECGDPTCNIGNEHGAMGVIAGRHELGNSFHGDELLVPYDWACFWPNRCTLDADGDPRDFGNDGLEPATRAFAAWAAVRFKGLLPPRETIDGCTQFYFPGQELYIRGGLQPAASKRIRTLLGRGLRAMKSGRRLPPDPRRRRSRARRHAHPNETDQALPF